MAGARRGAVERGDRRRLRGGDDAEPSLDQIFGEGRGMIGAAARAGQHRFGRRGAQPLGQRCDPALVAKVCAATTAPAWRASANIAVDSGAIMPARSARRRNLGVAAIPAVGHLDRPAVLEIAAPLDEQAGRARRDVEQFRPLAVEQHRAQPLQRPTGRLPALRAPRRATCRPHRGRARRSRIWSNIRAPSASGRRSGCGRSGRRGCRG